MCAAARRPAPPPSSPFAHSLASPPPPQNVPAVDYALALAAPLHGHVAMNYVISDYVPVAARMGARAGMLGLSLATVAGLLKLNREGPGVTGALKQLWKA